MSKKRNDNGTWFSDWSTNKLKKYYKELDERIENSSFGVKDMLQRIGVEAELSHRGIKIQYPTKFGIFRNE